MERGNTLAAGGMATTTGAGGVAAEYHPCPHCGMESDVEPTEGVECTVCGLTPEYVDAEPTGPVPLWTCHICGESDGANDDDECLACDMPLTGDELPPEPPSITITNPDGTTTTVGKNLDGTPFQSGAPPSSVIIPSGTSLQSLDPHLTWFALSERSDGTVVHTGEDDFLGLRWVRATRPDGTGTLTVRLDEPLDLPLFGHIPAHEQTVDFDADGNLTDADGNPVSLFRE